MCPMPTLPRRIDVFDYDKDHGLTGRRPFAQTPRSDGLTLDAEGHRLGRAARRQQCAAVLAQGALDGAIELPVTKVTACTFGGLRLDELYITTSREGLEAGDEPTPGRFSARRPASWGLPVAEFEG